MKTMQMTKADLRVLEEFEKKLARGEEEFIPSEFATRLIDGENPVRVWRELRGLPVRDLAAKAKISPAYLSQIEKGTRESSSDIIKRIAQGLELNVDDLA